MEGFDSPVLQDVAFNDDGSLKQTGKQSVKFYPKKFLSFKARPDLDEDGTQKRDEKGKLKFLIDPKTGIPFKDGFEEMKLMVRIETKGDTNIVDDVANDFHKRQYYRQYKFFREGKIPDGNPIEDFEFFQPSTITELHMIGIHVIQQAAVMQDVECEQLKDQSGYEVRDFASQWVKINSPQGQAGRASILEQKVARLERELEESKAGSRPSQQRVVLSAPVDGVIDAAETPIEIMELTPAEAAKNRKRLVK